MKYLKSLLAIFLFLLVASCSNDDGEQTIDTPTTGTENSNKVFVVGSEEINSKVVPIMWIDGIKTTLSSEADSNTEALAVIVENNDVYVVGKEKKEKECIVLWKNGVRSRVSGLVDFVSFKELVVDNGNIYILGIEDIESIQNESPIIMYWKNGVPVNIITSITSGKENRAENMVVSNNDVYLSGWEHDDTGKFTAKFWKNGIATTLSNSTQNSFGSSIVVEGASVSVLFSEINSSTLRKEVKLWKDKNISLIATSSGDIRTEQMIIKDNVRHIVMNENFGKLIYLKDNVRTEITPDGVSNDFLKMQVDGTNVCIAYNDNAIGKYWINGVTKTLAGVENVKSKNMFLSNDDVYSLVRGFAKTLFLKNATPSALPFDQSTLPVTEGIFVTK
jgi:hypothetical protein